MLKKDFAQRKPKFDLLLTAKTSPRFITETIAATFLTIEKYNDNSIIVSQELAELAKELRLHIKILNSVHMAILLHYLSNLALDDQKAARDIIEFGLKISSKLLADKKTAKQFAMREIAQLFNALPKLPIAWNQHPSLLSHLLTQTTMLVEKASFTAQDSAHILGGMAKLGIDLQAHDILINALCQPLTPTIKLFTTLEFFTLSELWQFFVYARVTIKDEKVEAYFALVENIIKDKSREKLTPSPFQQTIQRLLLKLLTDKIADSLKEEHSVGAYSLDLALLEHKLNIEVDGPFHYRDKKLKRIHQFRDYILKQYEQWTVVRIAHFELEELPKNEQAKLDYLLIKLADHAYIFNPSALERLSALQSMLKKLDESSKTTVKSTSEIPSVTNAHLVDLLGIFKNSHHFTQQKKESTKDEIHELSEENPSIKLASVNENNNNALS